MENVAIQPGDEVLYPSPGYPIYESQIEFHGGKALPYGYLEGGDNFRMDFESIERQITPRTRLLVFNDLQNPTGAECSAGERERIAELVLSHDLYVLCDEAYFDIRYSGTRVSLASLPGMAERCVILYSFSKKFAMTGWRLGAAIGPRQIIEVIAKLNVNNESCANHFIRYGVLAGLGGDQRGPRRILEILRERRDAAVGILNSIWGVRCFSPNATGAMRKRGTTDYNAFRRTMLEETGVSFCTRLHFGRPLPGEREFYVRFAYSGIETPMIREGLGRARVYGGASRPSRRGLASISPTRRRSSAGWNGLPMNGSVEPATPKWMVGSSVYPDM